MIADVVNGGVVVHIYPGVTDERKAQTLIKLFYY